MQKSLKSKGEPICRRYYRITRGLTEGGTISCSWAASALLWHRDSHDSVEIWWEWKCITQQGVSTVSDRWNGL